MASALLACSGVLASAPAWADLGAPVRIEGGLVAGAVAKDPAIRVFRGLPFAAAPVGNLRFRPPAPVTPWQGVRAASKPGLVCPQVRTPDIEGLVIGEDCLNLDVYTGATSSRERRPVMVWFHGGTRGAGGSSQEIFDGSALAKKGVVVVVVNYRGGPLGMLATPELSRESGHNASGNYGLMDNVASLKWVQRNIAQFGGDPAKVTIFGESFGAGTVNFLSLTPAAKGLFKRRITQSHSLYSRDPVLQEKGTRYVSLQDGEKAGERFMQILGVKKAAELRQLPWQKLFDAFTASFNQISWTYVIDGYVLPRNYSQTYAANAHADVDALTGENRDENGAAADTAFDRVAAGAAVPPYSLSLLPRSEYLAFVHQRYGAMADEYLKLYPADTDRQAFETANAAIRDNIQISPWMWAQETTPKRDKAVFIYMFSKAPPDPDHDVRGAYHGADVRYVFDNPQSNWRAQDRRVADMMSSYWVNFAKTGNPNGRGLPRWPAFDGKTEQTMELGNRFETIPFPSAAKIAFWKRFYASQPAQ
nr:carboxylesterase family protein [Novosphingobium flavum]